jgi:hypothetical protein
MGLFAEMFSPVTMVFIAAVAVVTWLLLSRSQRYFSQQRHAAPADEASPAAMFAKRAHNLDVPDAAARWEVQMYDTARELSAQLDSKLSALQALIADADRAAARLETALNSPRPLGEGQGVRALGKVEQENPILAADTRATNAGRLAPEISGQLPAGTPLRNKPHNQADALKLSRGIDLSALDGPSVTSKSPQRPVQDQQREEIYTLADYGFEPAEIASRVGRPIGEVQLILGLRQKK